MVNESLFYFLHNFFFVFMYSRVQNSLQHLKVLGVDERKEKKTASAK